MGRKSKLTDDQWAEIGARLLAHEKAADLSREYGVSSTVISRRFAQRNATVKSVANQLVTAEDALRALPVSQQLQALSLADELRAISGHAASAAKFGMATAHRLAGIANGLVQRIDGADPAGSMDDLKAVAAMGRIANDAAHIGLNLLAANKGSIPLDPPDASRRLREMTDDDLLAIAGRGSA